MFLAVIVGVTVLIAIAVIGAVGYVIDRNAAAHDLRLGERRPPE